MHTDWFVFSTSESSGVGCGGESGPILDVVARTHNLIGVDVFSSIARGHLSFENHAERRDS